jgi:hypothetical protein
MKFRNIIILAVAIVLLSQCKKDSEEPYSNEKIVLDNTQAALYFHTVFREAEYAWGFVDSVGYVSKTYEDKIGTATKKLTYDEDTKQVTVEYNAWVAANQLLVGTIYFTVTENAYKPQTDVITAFITVHLTDFSINYQSVTGSSKLQYRYVDGKNDQYACTLFDGSAIHEAGANKPVIITGAIANGQYERTKGSVTYTQKDDEWAYTGTMTGMLHDDPNLKYTNTVIPTYTMGNGEIVDGTVYFTPSCTKVWQGISEIKIPGRPDITYQYGCSSVFFMSVTTVN